MNRKAFDSLLSWVGALLTVVLLAAGILMNWGYSFANNTVRDQLKQQSIFFPKAGSPALGAKEFPKLQKYSEQQLLTGQQAADYANYFIAVHLKFVNNGKTYAATSGEARAAAGAAAAATAAAAAAPKDAALAAAAATANANAAALDGKVQTLFRGETLRGLLLNAYAFWKLGMIAHYASLGAFGATILMLILTLLGFRHRAKVEA